MKDQWKKGLQWGGLIWLAWLAMSSVAWLTRWVDLGTSAQLTIPAIGWTLAFALAWTRWSRLGVAIGIAAHVYAGVFICPPIVQRMDYQLDGAMTQSYLDLEPLLRMFVPECLPLVPLLFMAPSAPRYTASLALVGRWKDASREVVGLRWILVAAGVLVLHTAAPKALEWWTIDEHGVVVFTLWRIVGALAPTAILFGVAACRVPRDRLVSAR